MGIRIDAHRLVVKQNEFSAVSRVALSDASGLPGKRKVAVRKDSRQASEQFGDASYYATARRAVGKTRGVPGV